MKTPTKFVKPLSDQQRQELHRIMRDSESFRVRCRAHAILLSDSGVCLDAIALTFDVTHRTASSWLDRWEEDGIAGLQDKPRCGRTPILTPEEVELLLELLNAHPHQPRRVLAMLEEKTGKHICRGTLNRIARQADLRWKRTRRKPHKEPDPEFYAWMKEFLEELKEEHHEGELDLYYLDGTAFTLEPPVGYAWQRIGERLKIPSRKGGLMSVLGLWSLDNDFAHYVGEGTMNSEDVVNFLDAFSQRLTRPTWVILDNAPIHTAKIVTDHQDLWESRGMMLAPLPSYSPELNLIERLWEEIKYRWLPLGVYNTFETLWNGVTNILEGIGSKYKLCAA